MLSAHVELGGDDSLFRKVNLSPLVILTMSLQGVLITYALIAIWKRRRKR